ncbi:MAG: preprotein translocase subunit SecG [Arenicella sp.]|jgi:preprotein translocase subunit SecG
MKNLIVAVSFATFSLGLPYAMAQQVAAQDSIDVEKVIITANQNEGEKTDVGKRRIVIDIDTNEARDAEDEIRAAISTVRDLLGDEIGTELENEISNLSDDERDKVRLKLKKVFGGSGLSVGGTDGIHFGDGGGGIGFSEFLIAMTAIVFTLGLPVIILVLVLVFSNRKRKQKMAVISSYLEANQPVPEFVMAEFGGNSAATSSFRSGLTFLFVGIAMVIVLGLHEGIGAGSLGLIPIGIGLARLASWKYDTDQKNNSDDG